MRLLYTLSFAIILFSNCYLSEVYAEDNSTSVKQLDSIEQKLSRELRRVHREIAALRAEIEEPGINEILGGLGYIFGIFGTACYVAGRKNRR